MISIVVPLLNEQDSLVELVERIDASIQSNQLGAYEVLFVDDGSTDRSWDVIREIAAAELENASGIWFTDTAHARSWLAKQGNP